MLPRGLWEVLAYNSIQNSCHLMLLQRTKLEIYKTIIVPIVLYGCESWFTVVRKEYRFRVYKNRSFEENI
jgi:hypothetical protein